MHPETIRAFWVSAVSWSVERLARPQERQTGQNIASYSEGLVGGKLLLIGISLGIPDRPGSNRPGHHQAASGIQVTSSMHLRFWHPSQRAREPPPRGPERCSLGRCFDSAWSPCRF